ncbi:MAG: hypothetical protein NT025_02590 [bacterium]|nr:hypothetical protein [bacterium]
MTDYPTLTFPDDFGFENLSAIHDLTTRFVASLGPDGPKKVVLDLRCVTKFTPFSGCYLASLVKDLVSLGINVEVLRPVHTGASHQLDHLGIVAHFLGHPVPTTKRVRSVPLVHLHGKDFDLAIRMSKMVRVSLELTAANFYLVQLCLKELLLNAFDHGQSPKGTFCCAYGLRNLRIVRVCTMDHGMGVLAHLRQNPKYANLTSDTEALALCVRKGVSGTRWTRGLGLFYVTQALLHAGGEIAMASGSATMLLQEGKPPVFGNLSTPFTGTVVNVTFKVRKAYRFILDDLEDR